MNLSIDNQFGMRVRFLREQRKMSQEDLALEADLSKNYISDVECGRRNVSLKTMDKIAMALHVSLSTLLLGVGPKNN